MKERADLKTEFSPAGPLLSQPAPLPLVAALGLEIGILEDAPQDFKGRR
jgi:hypothetical protein